MASAKKKRTHAEKDKVAEEVEDNVSVESEDDDTDESENEFRDQEIQVEFEAQTPVDSDFNGIRSLLQQLFLKSNINLSELTDLIISQNYVGSVIKQVNFEEDDDSMDDDSDDTVFGVVTVINFSNKQDKECVKQIISLVTSHCQSVSPEQGHKLSEILHNHDEPVGFLINERFINIPPVIAVPSLQSLRKDIDKAVKKHMPFSMTHLLLLCKTYRYKEKAKAPVKTPSLFYSNPEEELIAEMCDISITWSVAGERDGVSQGHWEEDDMEATRTVLVFRADKLDAIIDRLKTELGA